MTYLRQCETHRIGYWHPSGCPMCKADADQGNLARALIDARAENARLRADAQAAVALAYETAADLHAKLWRETNGYKEAQIRALAPADGLAAVAELRKERDGLRRNLRETFEAMCAMLDAINEHVPMPSLESDLLQGPENSVFCAAVAEAVIADRDRLAAENAALEAQVGALRLQLDQKDALYDSGFQAGVKLGWNFGVSGDEAGFQAATSSTEHVAELKRIRAALAEVQARDDASTPPDTWHERRTMLPDGDARKGEG